MSFPSSDALDRAASLMNDTARVTYTYTAMLPYYRIAYDELKEFLQESNIPITNKVSAVITVPIGTTSVGFATTPSLPSDLITIEAVYERRSGSSQNYEEMASRDFLTINLQSTSSFGEYAWLGQEIKLPLATAIIELKLEYIAETLGNITDENTQVSLI